MKPIICVHGLQGSGKSYLINHISQFLDLHGVKYSNINIKSTFRPLFDQHLETYKNMGYDLNEAQSKQLMLSISTYGEMFLDTKIWTNQWLKAVSQVDSPVLVDDIRTQYNLDGLVYLCSNEKRPIIFIKLDIPEEIRRQRLGDKWRDNGGYTESLLEKPEELPEGFMWLSLDSWYSVEDIKNLIYTGLANEF